MKKYKPHASSVGDAAANLVSVACYLSMLLLWSMGFIPIIIIFFVEKKSGLVRFHAMQALLLWVLSSVAGGWLSYEGLAAVLTGDASYLYSPFSWMSDVVMLFARALVSGLVIIFAIVAIARAYRWQDWRIPLLGQLAAYIVAHCAPAMYNGEGTVPHGCERGYSDYAKPEWQARWQKQGQGAYQQMLPPPPPPKPVLEGLKEAAPPPMARPQPAPVYTKPYVDDEVIDVEYEDVVERPEQEAYTQQTLYEPPPLVYQDAEPAAPPLYNADTGRAKAAPADEEDSPPPEPGGEWVVEPLDLLDYDIDYNEQIPGYMRDPDPVTAWMEDPLPNYPVTPGTTPPPRAAAPVPQNLKYSVTEGYTTTRKAPKSGKGKRRWGAKKNPKDDPNSQLPPEMRDPPNPYDMY